MKTSIEAIYGRNRILLLNDVASGSEIAPCNKIDKPLVVYRFFGNFYDDFMMSFSDDKHADVIDAFNTNSRYLDDSLNNNNVNFDNMVNQIYPSELQLKKANTSDTEAEFLDLHLSISNDIVSTKIYDKRDDFDFEIVNFPF